MEFGLSLCCDFWTYAQHPILVFPYVLSVPEQIGLTEEIINPALPPLKKTTLPSRFRPPPKVPVTKTKGIGSKRVYLDIQAQPPNVAYPPRPVPGSVADLDIVMDNCDFSENKVRSDIVLMFIALSGIHAGSMYSMFAIVLKFYVWALDWIMANG